MRSQEISLEYLVTLSRDGEFDYQTIIASSRDRAADMCEKRCGDGWTADSVTMTQYSTVAGRCDRCRMVLFTDQRLQHLPHGVRCADC